jgi:oligoendopeptidase F
MALDQGTAVHSLPERSEVPEAYKWRLEDMYPSDDAWEADVAKVRELLGRIGSFHGRLSESGEVLLQCLELQDRLGQLNEKIYVYAHMRKDEDNANPVYQALSSRAETLGTEVASATSFIVPEILAIPDDRLASFRASIPGLALYDHFLDDLIRHKPHTRSAGEEQILAMAGEISQAPRNIFGMLNNADLKFPVIRDEEGREVELTKGRYIQFMESRDRRVRKDAFEALYHVYRAHRNTLAATLNASIRKDIFHARVRNFPSSLEAALFPDNVPVEVYDQLIQTVRRRMDAMHKYVALRKKALGLDALHMYDLYTPIVKNVDMKIPFEEAVKGVEEGLRPLGEEYLAALRQGLRSGWIDVYENRGKTSGAYSWGAYGTHPYVLLNYQDSVDHMFTLAHEMGHAMHSYYSQQSQPYVYAHYTIFVAEVASTLNESLLMQHLLSTKTDRKEKLYILNHYLEQFRGTVYRQTMFAEFEKITHQMAESGEALTPDVLCAVYRDLNKDYYGPEMVIDDEIEMEWARIPHFYNAFYVYKYATGFSAATALSQQILQEGEPAVRRYLQFLRSGGSDYPLELLRKAGVDMATPAPVEEALSVFDRLVDEMGRLLEEEGP